MTTKKIMLMLMAAMTMVSCNLFIEEEDDGLEFKNVPVHTGEGYDKPVTTTQSGCEIVYQYNSEVRVLSQEDQDRYIVYAARDGANCFAEIHYLKSTPADKLPVLGEILLSTVTEKFPWGCNHRVQQRYDGGDVYKFILGFCNLEETFKDLRINGTLSMEDKEEYSIPIDREMLTPVEDDVEPDDTTSVAGARRSATEFDVADGLGHVKLDGPAIEFSSSYEVPFPKIEYKEGYGQLNFKDSVNTSLSFDFSDFSIIDRQFKAKMTQTVYEKWELTINGGYSKSIRLLQWPVIRGKAVVIGPVVVVLFLNFEIHMGLDIQMTGTLTREKEVQNVYEMDFKELTLSKSKPEITKDSDWTFDAAVEASLSIDIKFVFGLGIYGKIVSVRIIPTFSIGISAKVPIMSVTTDDDEEKLTSDISDKPGITFKPLDLSVTIGVYMDLKLKEILGALHDQLTSATEDILKEYEADYKEKSEFYQAVTDDENSVLDPAKKKYYKKGEGHESEDVGLSYTFGPWDLISHKTIPWYPTIKDNSFKITAAWDHTTRKMSFNGEFQIDKVGYFASTTAGLSQYVPVLRVVNSKDGNGKPELVYSNEAGHYENIKSGKTYHFTIPNKGDDLQYYASPGYVVRDLKVSKVSEAIDKPLPFSFTAPSLAVTKVVPLKGSKAENTDPIYSKDGDKYPYKYTYRLDTYTAVRGTAYIDKWWVNELWTGQDSNDANTKKESDGIYQTKWEIFCYSFDDELEGLMLHFLPCYTLKDKYDPGHGQYSGVEYKLLMQIDGKWFDGGYYEDDDGVWKNYAPGKSLGDGCIVKEPDSRDIIVSTVKEIVDPQGRTIYKNGQDELPGLMPL